MGLIIYRWQSIDGLLDVGAPILPVAAYAIVNLVRFSSHNKLYRDDSEQALFLFAFISIAFPIAVNSACIVVILAVDSSILGTGFAAKDGREVITWLEVSLGAGYAVVVEGLFKPSHDK